MHPRGLSELEQVTGLNVGAEADVSKLPAKPLQRKARNQIPSSKQI
jgi:hypothetical protein